MNQLRHAVFDYVQAVGPMYGVEDFAVFLYSLVRMQKPRLMIELGSGSGACALLSAQAMLENGEGRLISVDHGGHWPKLRERRELAQFSPQTAETYHAFMNSLVKRYSLSGHLVFEEGLFPPFPRPEAPIDILFSDYQSQPAAIAALLAHFLPLMSAASSIFIDGASTYLPSFLYLERIVEELNRGKLPASLLHHTDPSAFPQWSRLVQTRKFTLVHLTEKKDRDQNGAAWLKIEPIDHQPHPATTMR